MPVWEFCMHKFPDALCKVFHALLCPYGSISKNYLRSNKKSAFKNNSVDFCRLQIYVCFDCKHCFFEKQALSRRDDLLGPAIGRLARTMVFILWFPLIMRFKSGHVFSISAHMVSSRHAFSYYDSRRLCDLYNWQWILKSSAYHWNPT